LIDIQRSLLKLGRNLAKSNQGKPKGNAQRSKPEALFASFIWLCALCYVALPNGTKTRIGVINLPNDSSAQLIRESWGLGDAGSILEAALTWSDFKQLDSTNQFWIPRLWSLGLSIIEVPLIWMERFGLGLFWTLLVTTLALYISIFYILWRYFSVLVGRGPIIFASGLLIATWDFQYMFRSYLFYTEGIGYGLLFLGLLLLTRWILDENRGNCPKSAGVLIGFSIWVRHTSELGLLILLTLSFLGWACLWIVKKNKDVPKSLLRYKAQFDNNARLQVSLEGMLKVSFIATLVTLPWRLISFFVYKSGSFMMSTAGSGVGANIWATPESGTVKYWNYYGINWACDIDPTKCRKISSEIEQNVFQGNLLVEGARTAIVNFPSYLSNRIQTLSQNWIPEFNTLSSHQAVIASFFLLLVPGIIFLFLRISSQEKYLILILWFSFLLMQGLQLLVIHYEPRYFIPIRLLILGLALSLFSIYEKEKRCEWKQVKEIK
jgi:hypothetical protein